MENYMNKRILYILSFIIIFIIINIIISFSYLTGATVNKESSSTLALKAGSMYIKFESENAEMIANNITPGYETTKSFTVTSVFGDNHDYYKYGLWYSIVLIVDENEYDDDSFVYSLTVDETSSSEGITATEVTDIGIKSGQNQEGIIIGSGLISKNNITHAYNLKLKYEEKGIDQSHEIGCSFKAHIVIKNPDLLSIEFDLNGGKFENLYMDESNSIEVPINSKIKFPTPTSTAARFDGWEIVDGNGSVESNYIITNIENIKVVAKWTSYNKTFNYLGSEEEYVVLADGYYKLEVWGAQGGTANSTYIGGYGAYSIGIIQLNKDSTLYINIGGKGNTTSTEASQTAIGGYNGGGDGKNFTSTGRIFGSGGGATHISKTSGLLSSLSSYESVCQNLSADCPVIIVAGGGGGAAYYNSSYYGQGGHAGGYIGSESSSTSRTKATAGTQTSGAGFGQGGSATSTERAGGGGGFYGGNLGFYNAAGGSGYIGNPLLTDKYMYCYNCTTSDVDSTKTYTTTCAEETPTENCAKIGNGFAKITFLSE